MKKANNFFFDGKNLKGFNLPMSWDSDVGWDVYGEVQIPNDKMFPFVSAAFRAMSLNADAVSTMPFAIVDGAGNDILSSEDWHESDHAITTILPDPQTIMYKVYKSLAMRNVAYLLLERKKGLTYLVPDTIRIEADSINGITGFKRHVGTREIYYKYPGELIPLIRSDWDTEIMPSPNTIFRAIMLSTGILYKSDYYVSDFFGRGGIKPHLLKVAGMPTPEERTRIQEWFDKLMSGLTQHRSKVINAEAMDALPIGTGVDDFKDNSFYKQALENIAIGTGIPLSLLLANSANFATARVEEKQWYEGTIIPWAKWIARRLTVELFAKMDLRMDIREDIIASDTEDESRRATSFSTIAGTLQKSGHPKANSIAAQLVGFDMPQGMEYEDLDERDESRIPQPPAPFGGNEEPKQDETEEEDDVEDANEEVQKAFVPNAAQIKELHNWQDITTRKFKRGDGVPNWDVAFLPAEIADTIKARLQTVTTAGQIEEAFNLSSMTQTAAPVYQESEIKYLAEALIKFAETPQAVPMQYDFHLPQVTVNTPEHKYIINPDINMPPVVVNVPEQPPATVNVTNQVETPSVTVNNDVRPSEVTVIKPEPRSAKVKRDRSGKITGLEAE